MTECSSREQTSVIKVLLAKKCKQCEIFRRKCDVFGVADFSLKKFTNGLNMDFLRQVQAKKIVDGVETH